MCPIIQGHGVQQHLTLTLYVSNVYLTTQRPTCSPLSQLDLNLRAVNDSC